MASQATGHLEVLVTDPGQLYDLLEDAEAALREVALPECCAGILVTRHNPGRYTSRLATRFPSARPANRYSPDPGR